MNKTNKLLPLIALCSISVNSALADTVSIRADSWFPMNGEPNSDAPGYMIELATKIFSEAGHTVDYRTMPWERALLTVREGQFDCVVGAYKEDAPDFVFPTESWGLDQPTFYVNKETQWTYDGIASLDNITLGVIGGYSYSEALDTYVSANAKGNISTVKGDGALEKNIKKMLAGRISATIESNLVMDAQLKKTGNTDDIVKAGKLGDSSDMYIACSPNKDSSKSLMSLVDEGTRKLRASGELQKIMEKYGLSDWK